MPSEKLVNLKAGKGLEAGLFPSAEPTAGQPWNTGQNIWFRELSLEQVLGRQKIINITGAPPTSLAQAFNSPNKSLYYENGGLVFQLNGTGNPTVFGTPSLITGISTIGSIWLEPWGTWLIISDNINQLSLWQGAIGVAPIPIGTGQFKTAKIVKKLAQFAVAYSTDVAPNGFAWCNVSDPTAWTPSINGAARNLIIRDLDSEIVAVCDLGAAHAVYSRETMLLVQYVGPAGGWLGTPSQALQGIGAVSRYSVVSVGGFNFGLSRNGIFSTNGVTFNYADRPQLDKWLQENVDWTKADQVWGYWNERLSLVIWYVPLLASSSYYSVATPRIGIGMDPKTRTVTSESIYLSRKGFSFLEGSVYGGVQREIFDQPVVIKSDGLYFESLPGTLNGTFQLTSHLFDGGEQGMYKIWDYGIFSGTFDSSTQVRFGFTDFPTTASIVWTPYQPLLTRCPFSPRESIFVAVDFLGTTQFNLTELSIFGEKGGFVN